MIIVIVPGYFGPYLAVTINLLDPFQVALIRPELAL